MIIVISNIITIINIVNIYLFYSQKNCIAFDDIDFNKL